MSNIVRKIGYAMSLRTPQQEALSYLSAISESCNYCKQEKAAIEAIASEHCENKNQINAPAATNSNGAACHSCCMISETACENGNRMLDRGLVVPIAERESNAFFGELVKELCQLEM